MPPLTNADTVLREAICVSYKKSEISCTVSELNPKLWKARALPQALQQSPRVLNHKIVQLVIGFEVMSTQHKKRKS